MECCVTELQSNIQCVGVTNATLREFLNAYNDILDNSVLYGSS